MASDLPGSAIAQSWDPITQEWVEVNLRNVPADLVKALWDKGWIKLPPGQELNQPVSGQFTVSPPLAVGSAGVDSLFDLIRKAKGPVDIDLSFDMAGKITGVSIVPTDPQVSWSSNADWDLWTAAFRSHTIASIERSSSVTEHSWVVSYGPQADKVKTFSTLAAAKAWVEQSKYGLFDGEY